VKNYTSSVPVERTVARIEAILAKAGASAITKDYQQGRLVALCFTSRLPNDRIIAVRLPADQDAVFSVFREQVRRPRRDTLDRLRLQAARTAWKLMQDWVEVQISLIQMRQADFAQVFLPYVWDGSRTFYAALVEQNYRLLPGPKGSRPMQVSET